MKNIVGAVVIGMTLLTGCGENGPPPDLRGESQALANARPTPDRSAAGGMDDAVVSVNGQPLTMRQLVDPLIESHGLTILLDLVEIELAKEDAAKLHIVVTAKDFEEQREAMLEKLCKSADESAYFDAIDKATAKNDTAEVEKQRKALRAEREEFLTQLLTNQHVDPVEFGIKLQINTYLRKIAEPQIEGRIDDAALHRAFGQMYGEKLHVHYIELNNMNEVGQAMRRLAAGDRFDDVARDMSHNAKSAALGGELPAFTRQSSMPPDAFKNVAFDLKDGAVSDVVSYNGSYLLIKRIELIAPKAVKFEDQKPIVFKTLHTNLLEAVTTKLKQDLAAQVIPAMHFADPKSVLAVQFDQRTRRMKAEADKAREDLDRHQRLINPAKVGATQPTTDAIPGTAPATGASTQPETGPALPELPKLVPATQPASVPTTGK